MGKTISIYLDDYHLQCLEKYGNNSQVIKEALDMYFKTSQRGQGFKQVLKIAKTMGKSKGFDEAIDGMYQGESKTVTIPCAKAYGTSKPELFETIDRSLIGDKVELTSGGQLEVTSHDGSVFYVMVSEVTADTVTLDANHPLADKDLIFDIELLEVTKHQQG